MLIVQQARALICGLAFTLGIAAGSTSRAEVDLKGKQLTIVIGYGVGGTYYQYAQLFADHLSRHLPDTPKIVVQSMPGAGGLKMLNNAAKLMPADGTTLFVPPDTMLVSQLLEKDSVQFDARKFSYLGTADQQNNFWVVRKAAAATLQAAKTSLIITGHSGRGSTGLVIPALANWVLGLNMKLIGGYEGARDTILAIQRGEVDAGCFGWETWALAVPQWFDAKEPYAVPLFQLGFTPDPDRPDVPLLSTFAKPEQLPVLDLFGTIGVIGRGLAFPPGVPEETVMTFRKAFEAMLNDSAYQEDSKKRLLRIVRMPAAELTKVINDTIGKTDAAVIETARQFMGGG